MNNTGTFFITREKHLDHMVRVVPFIVFCYAVQCYVIYSMNPGEFSTVGLSILGAFLGLMIAGFIAYDLKHKVELKDHELEITFFAFKKTIRYEDIWSIQIKDPDQNFSSLTLTCQNSKHIFYFIDEGEKIKKWLEDKKQVELKTAA